MSKGVDYKAYVLANLRVSPVKSAILGVAAIVLMVLLARQVMGGPKLADADQEFELAGGAESVAPATGGATIQRLPRPRIDAVIRRDPFRAPWIGVEAPAGEGAVSVQPGSLRLQATLTRGAADTHSALISGVMVHVGDTVEGYRVVAIGDRSAELSGHGQRITLTMGRSAGGGP